MKTLIQTGFILSCSVWFGFAIPGTADAAPGFGITTSSTTTSTTTFVVSGTAALATGTNPMWFEVRSGSSTGPLIDLGAFAAKASWQFEVRHLQTGTNIVTVFAGVSGNLATASINLTFVLDDPNTPSVRPRPRGAEIWWGGVSFLDQTVINPNDWQYVQRHEDGFFVGPGGWKTSYDDSVAQQLVALLTGSGALNAPAVRFWYESPCHQAQGISATVNGQVSWLRRMEGDGFVVSEITTDFGADIDTYCRQHPDWPSNDILAWNTGDASVATPGGPYLSNTNTLNGTGWSGYLSGVYPAFPHSKIAQTWSPAGFQWKDPSGYVHPAYAWDVLSFDPLVDTAGNTIYVNGQPVYFNWTQDQLWACDLNIAAAQSDSFHQYYAFTTDFPHLYTTGVSALGVVDFTAYSAAAIRKKIIAYEAWLHSQGCRHSRICNADDASSLSDPVQQNLYYENSSLDIMQTHQLEGGRADRYLLESWETGIPNQVTPETTPGTYTNLAKNAIKYIKGINDDGSYEALHLVVNSSSGGAAVIQITNNGDVACLPAVTVVESGDSHFTTQYFGADGSDATAAALGAEGYVPSALLQPGASTTFTILAVPTSGAPANATRTFALEAFWNPQDPTGYVRDRRTITLGAVQPSSGNVKANNTTALNQTASWTGGAVPGLNDVAQWDSTVTGANTVSLGANLSWGGINIVSPGGNVAINSGNTLTLYAAGVNLGLATRNLTFNNAVTLGAPQTWNVAAGCNLRVNGALTGGSSTVLVKTGSGVVTIASSVNFPGIISLASGTLSVTTSNASLGGLSGASGAVLQSGGGNLTIGGNGVATAFAGGITGASSLVKSGSGMLTLTGSSSYTGSTTVSSGTLQLGNGFVLGTGTATVINNATLLINRDTPLTLKIQGTGTVVKAGNGTFTKAAGVTETYPALLVTGGTFAVGGGTLSLTSTSYVESGGTFQITAGTVNNTSCLMYLGASGPGTLNVSGGTLNVGQLIFGDLGDGLGTLTVSGSGVVSASILQLSDNGPAVINLNGGTLFANTITSPHGESSIWLNGGVLKANTAPSSPWISSAVGVLGVQNGGAIFDTNGQNVTIAEPLLATLNSTGGLTKQGSGKLTLTCSNTYVGTTAILAGTLILSSTASIATSGTIDVRAGALLDVTAQGGGFTTLPAQTLMGSGTVTGGLTISGTHRPGNSPGIQTFTGGTATYGPTSHLTWELVANSSTTPGTNFDQVVASSLVFNTGAVIDVVLSGSGSATTFTNAFWSSTQTWTLASCAATTGVPNIGSVTTDSGGRNASTYGWFSISNTAAGIILTWSPGVPSTTVTVTAAVGSIAETSAPAGAYTITRSGTTGNLTVFYAMSGSATPGLDYAPMNSVTIPAGNSSATVNLSPIDNNRVDGSRSAILTLVYGGNYLIGSQASATVAITDNEQRFTWNNPSTSGTLKWSESANWNGSTAATSGSVGTVEFFTGQTLASGTVTANNDIANPLLLDVLTLGGTGATGTTSSVTLTGGTLQLVANAGYSPVVNLDATDGANSGTLTYKITNPVILSATTNVQGQGTATFNFNGAISGTGGIVKSGSSMLTLSASNSFTGAMAINAGTVYVSNTNGLHGSPAISVAPGGQLSLFASGTFTTGTLTLSGTGCGSGSASQGGALYNSEAQGTITIPAPIVLAAGTTVQLSSYSAGATINLTGSISGNAPLVFWCSGAAITHLQTWVLSGSSTYTGDTTVDALAGSQGVLRLSGGDNRLPVTTRLTLNPNVLFSGTTWNYVNFDLNGCNQTLAGLSSLGSGTSSVINSGTTPATLTINGTSSTTFSGILGGTGTGTNLNIVKSGTGTWTLSGTVSSAYIGTTTVTAGTLALTGTLANNIPNTKTINIQSGATLDVTGMTAGLTLGGSQLLTGAGLVSGTLTVTGIHQPGNGIGIGLFAGSLTYGTTSHLAWGLNGNTVAGPGANYDQVSAGIVTGSSGAVIDVILNGPGSSVDFTDAFWTSSQTWTVINASSASGAFAVGSVTGDANGVAAARFGNFSSQTTASSVLLVWTPTPFNAWKQTNFGADAGNSAIAGDSANPMNDGTPNLMKYALGLDPNAHATPGGLPVAYEGGGYLSLTYTKVKSDTDIVYQVFWSPGLVTWSGSGVTEETLSDNGTTQQIKAKVPVNTGDTRKFIRLQVTRP